MPLVEIGRETEASDEVIAGDLDRRLADLERALRGALEEPDRERRQTAPQLAREQGAREAGPDDRDVEGERRHRRHPRSAARKTRVVQAPPRGVAASRAC